MSGTNVELRGAGRAGLATVYAAGQVLDSGRVVVPAAWLRAAGWVPASEVVDLREQLGRCRGWLLKIRRLWTRWDDVRTLRGEPSCTQEADVWLDAYLDAPPSGGKEERPC